MKTIALLKCPAHTYVANRKPITTSVNIEQYRQFVGSICTIVVDGKTLKASIREVVVGELFNDNCLMFITAGDFTKLVPQSTFFGEVFSTADGKWRCTDVGRTKIEERDGKRAKITKRL